MNHHPKKASVISIGNEVLSGRTVDTNAAYIARQLRIIGVPVVSSYTVADEGPAIQRALQLAGEDADMIITTGGLGPTDDDLTRQAFAAYLGVDLVLQEDLLARLREFFERRGRAMAEKNQIQACLPTGATAIENEMGTAPGLMAEKDGRLLLALPGVPREMRHMLETAVVPRLKAMVSGQSIVVRRLRCYGAGESNIAEMVGQAMRRGRNPLVNCTAGAGVITLEIVATAPDRGEAEEMAVAEDAALREILGPLVFGAGDETLAEVVGQRLAQSGRTLAVAESCTGGLLAKLITDVPGASRYFAGGWIAYSNEIKTRELGVPWELIETQGAVSEPVAAAMAQGARRKAHADLAVAITGIAGPAGGSEQKPVGLVYIAVSDQEHIDTPRYVFPQDRNSVRLRAAQTALNMLRLRLEV
ncbi:MAG: competence/damage-inducible protein A [Sedimentisphaerales bacterium]|nr:competence/damage-inducible protein A [Sedimentisphaerales bacterium]